MQGILFYTNMVVVLPFLNWQETAQIDTRCGTHRTRTSWSVQRPVANEQQLKERQKSTCLAHSSYCSSNDSYWDVAVCEQFTNSPTRYKWIYLSGSLTMAGPKRHTNLRKHVELWVAHKCDGQQVVHGSGAMKSMQSRICKLFRAI